MRSLIGRWLRLRSQLLQALVMSRELFALQVPRHFLFLVQPLSGLIRFRCTCWFQVIFSSE